MAVIQVAQMRSILFFWSFGNLLTDLEDPPENVMMATYWLYPHLQGSQELPKKSLKRINDHMDGPRIV
jgi:hypothetical protein